MKNIIKIYIAAIVLSALAGCKKFLDVNINTAVPQEASAELLLPPIQYQMANGTSQDNRFIWKITQDMCGVTTSSFYYNWEIHGFASGSDLGGVIWRMTYVDLGLNLENLINDAVANGKYEYAGIGYAIKAWAFQQCTDLYGPIILDKAFDPQLLSFPYQDQPDVYAKVREWGNLALKYLNMTSASDSYATTLAGPSGDYIYKGDKEKWKKFVYGLFALQYSHLKNKADFNAKYADSVIKYANLSFADETESATLGFTATNEDDSNPLGPTAGYINSTRYGYPTTTILNYLTGGVRGVPAVSPKTSIDPRLSRMLTASTATSTLGEYQAVIPAQGSNTPNVRNVLGTLTTGANAGYLGKYLFADKARYPIMSYAQVQFAKAEAAFTKGDKPTAFTAYINGIKGHMDFVNQYGRSYPSPEPLISATETNAYLGSAEVAQNAGDLKISDIMAQKYIAQWGWAAMEQWCDIRKYHYDPAVYTQFLQFGPDELSSNNKGKYAYRFRPRYNSEYVWNQAELDKWGGLALDYMTKETWFSQP